IAFSNHAMYEGGLLTIPSTAGAAAASALHWVAVEDGKYNAGENLPEAQRVVDVVDELLGRNPQPTVGVVTFNLKQRKAVLDAIEARCATDAGFRTRWTDAAAGALDERPFVKNLEQVQGDERDVIVFSLGHAPQVRYRGGVATDETYVPARFGPLGQRGGERRLNVAISRAKAACYVVASFDPAQLTVASSKHQGPRLFKHFLEFAHLQHHGRRLEASRVLDLVRAGKRVDSSVRNRLPVEGFVPLQTQLALALEAAGIPYELDVGTSEFRIPLAVLDPNDPTRFALALLLQDGTGPSEPFDVHVHRPGVLLQRGWRMLPITAASWHRRSAELIAEIEALVPGCRGAASNAIYQRHRAVLAPSATAIAATATGLPPRRAHSTSANPLFAASAPAPGESGPNAAPRPSATMPAQPAWALAITDELFRAALLFLDRHGELGEGDLNSIVGGPRRARKFATELDALRPGLPFGVEITDIGGTKVYRKVGTA
ncbi:MAG TPA: AAA domain-containing protein, partial [Kofleriaceae bacterium]|nr:AAA domain-containing protein [Kofleriaceae bacterium]